MTLVIGLAGAALIVILGLGHTATTNDILAAMAILLFEIAALFELLIKAIKEAHSAHHGPPAGTDDAVRTPADR